MGIGEDLVWHLWLDAGHVLTVALLQWCSSCAQQCLIHSSSGLWQRGVAAPPCWPRLFHCGMFGSCS